jgi:predicted nucleic acid-binding protein
MAYKKVFIDSDVILDLILWREPFVFYSQVLLNLKFKHNIALNTSPLVMANINYVLAKKVGKEAAKNHIQNLFNFVDVLDFEGDIIKKAVNSLFADMEDAIQFFIAERNNCDVIVTRNIKDYKNSTIPVLTAEQFLRTL